MNTITIAEIKSGGMDALDIALQRGAATIMKRNRPAAIVLTPMAYESLLAKASNVQQPSSALDWLLSPTNTHNKAQNPNQALGSAAMAQRLNELKEDWPER